MVQASFAIPARNLSRPFAAHGQTCGEVAGDLRRVRHGVLRGCAPDVKSLSILSLELVLMFVINVKHIEFRIGLRILQIKEEPTQGCLE